MQGQPNPNEAANSNSSNINAPQAPGGKQEHFGMPLSPIPEVDRGFSLETFKDKDMKLDPSSNDNRDKSLTSINRSNTLHKIKEAQKQGLEDEAQKSVFEEFGGASQPKVQSKDSWDGAGGYMNRNKPTTTIRQIKNSDENMVSSSINANMSFLSVNKKRPTQKSAEIDKAQKQPIMPQESLSKAKTTSAKGGSNLDSKHNKSNKNHENSDKDNANSERGPSKNSRPLGIGPMQSSIQADDMKLGASPPPPALQKSKTQFIPVLKKEQAPSPTHQIDIDDYLNSSKDSKPIISYGQFKTNNPAVLPRPEVSESFFDSNEAMEPSDIIEQFLEQKDNEIIQAVTPDPTESEGVSGGEFHHEEDKEAHFNNANHNGGGRGGRGGQGLNRDEPDIQERLLQAMESGDKIGSKNSKRSTSQSKNLLKSGRSRKNGAGKGRRVVEEAEEDEISLDPEEVGKPTLEPDSLCSTFTLSYLYKPYHPIGSRRLEFGSLYALDRKYKYQSNKRKFDLYVKKVLQEKFFFSIWSLVFYFDKIIFRAVFFLLLSTVFQLLLPQAVQDLIFWFDEDERDHFDSMYIFVLIFVTLVLYAFFLMRATTDKHRIALLSSSLLRGYCSTEIIDYSESEGKFLDLGRLLEVIQKDTDAVEEAVSAAIELIAIPIQFILIQISLCCEIGFAGLIPSLGFVILIMTQSFLYEQMVATKTKQAALSERRNHLVAEVTEFLKDIKCNGWEEFFKTKFEQSRELEADTIKHYLKLLGWFMSVNFFGPLTLLFLALTAYELFTGRVDTEKSYITFLLTFLLSFPLLSVTKNMKKISTGQKAMERVNSIIVVQKLKDEMVLVPPMASDDDFTPFGSIKIRNAYFTWEDDYKTDIAHKLSKFNRKRVDLSAGAAQLDKSKAIGSGTPKLTDLNIEFKNGQATAIIGSSGSGKTSLIMAILNQMNMVKGELQKRGKVAYVAQNPFICRDTIQNNILFGKPFDKELYNRVVKACKLEGFIQFQDNEDQAEITETSKSLTPNIQARISIARALYSDSDIYLIDDCLFSIDKESRREIIRDVVFGFLQGKTRVVVTFDLNLLSKFDQIVALNDGMTVLVGSPTVLDYSLELKDLNLGQERNRQSDGNKTEHLLVDSHTGLRRALKQRLTYRQKIEQLELQINAQEEVKATTRREDIYQKNHPPNNFWTNLRFYVGKMGLFSHPTLCLAALIACLVFMNLTYWFLGQWGGNRSFSTLHRTILSLIFLGLLIGCLVFYYAYQEQYFEHSFKFTSSTFSKILWNVLRRPLSHFQKRPLTNTQSSNPEDSLPVLLAANKNLEKIDFVFSTHSIVSLHLCLSLLVVMLITCIVNPFILILVFFIVSVCSMDFKRFSKAVYELRGLLCRCRAPLRRVLLEIDHGHIQLSLYGYKKSALKKWQRLHDRITCVKFHQAYLRESILWTFSLYMCVFFLVAGGLIVVGDMFELLLFPNDTGTLSFAMTNLLKEILFLPILTAYLANLTDSSTSIQSFRKELAEREREEELNKPTIHKEWPRTGHLKIEGVDTTKTNTPFNVSLDTNRGLRSLNLDIRHKEKLGIVGKSNSGKSEILYSILRLFELRDDNLERTCGAIYLDGQDIGYVGLHILRKNVPLITKNPLIFEGTLRQNIDPFEEYTDKEIVAALQKLEFLGLLHEFKEDIWSNKNIKSRVNQTLKRDREDMEGGRRPRKEVDKSIFVVDEEPELDAFILNFWVQSKGANLSYKQKCLVGVARALILKPKLVLVDRNFEGPVDPETRQFLDNRLMDCFKNSTIIMVLRDVEKISCFDRLAVIEDGGIAELGDPFNLMDLGERGKLYQMILAQKDSFRETELFNVGSKSRK